MNANSSTPPRDARPTLIACSNCMNGVDLSNCLEVKHGTRVVCRVCHNCYGNLKKCRFTLFRGQENFPFTLLQYQGVEEFDKPDLNE